MTVAEFGNDILTFEIDRDSFVYDALALSLANVWVNFEDLNDIILL